MKKQRGLIFIGIGFELIALILTAVYLSHYLEETYPQNGIWHAGLIITALVMWLVHIFLLVKSLDKK